MKAIDPRAFEFAMSNIQDGFVFERFAQDLLGHVLGHSFIPVGGVGDKAIDGLEHCYEPTGVRHTIYQMSIEKNAEGKIRRTIEALRGNAIQCSRLFYVTNQQVTNEHEIVERLYNDSGVSVAVNDLSWLRGKVNTSEATARTYLAFVEANCHQFIAHPVGLEVADLVQDPRVFIYLRQQWEDRDERTQLDQLLADTLILIGLEGTDPDKGILRSEQDLVDQAAAYVKFPFVTLEPVIRTRLAVMSSKPKRRIRHHTKENKFCLPYETRLELNDKQLRDAALQQRFFSLAENRLRGRLTEQNVKVRDAAELLNLSFNRLFKQQGLEFANFLLNGEAGSTVEKSLPDIISQVVDDSKVIVPNRHGVKKALLGTVREIIYKGAPEELEYLHCLSNCYMMLFLLQCEPKLALFFGKMASRLRLLVDNSLIVPAMSELPLDPRHRRHWNLLKKAQAAGVSMYVTRETVAELSAHIARSRERYKDLYAGSEREYADETRIMYVDEILIRSYLYSRLDGNTDDFDRFIDNFVTPGAKDAQRELVIWLRGAFGIRLLDHKTEDIRIDANELGKLSTEMARYKDPITARSDAHTVLTIFVLRERDKEDEESGVYGYKTWWLSKDTTSQRALQAVLGDRYRSDMYMRADYLNNYIALAPNSEQINRAFDAMFPTLVGVSVSHHVPQEICRRVQNGIRDHAGREPARVAAILATLSDRLKGGEGPSHVQGVTHYLDEKFAELRADIDAALR